MSLRFPLSVRINDGSVDLYVSNNVTNLRFKKVAPGGFHSLTMSLTIDPAVFPDLGPSDRVWVYGPTGAVIFEGLVENPGVVIAPGGSGFDLSAMGTIVLASDRSEALIYADRDLSQWDAYHGIAIASGSTSPDPALTDPLTADGLLVQLNRGAISPGQFSQMNYLGFFGTNMEFGSITARFRSGLNSSNYRNQAAYSGPGITSGAFNYNSAISLTSVFTALPTGTAGGPPSGTKAIGLNIQRTAAAGSIADDFTLTWFSEICVFGRRMNRNGVLMVGSAQVAQSNVAVRADWIVEDLLGRILTVCDKNAAQVDTASFLIDQLAYPDGATAADVLDDLEVYEPDFLWEMLHHNGSGYVFNYRAWPTTVRYEVSTRDGYDAPGAEFDLCNRVLVRWTDVSGNPQTTTVTATSAQYPALKALEDQGRIRDAAPITLPEGRGSAANAQRAGQQLLAQKADPPKAATVVVRRPIVDLLRGGTAMPYEIEPGYLVRVRETGDVLRLTEVEVDDEAGSATLTLGEPVLTEEQRLARLENVRRRAA